MQIQTAKELIQILTFPKRSQNLSKEQRIRLQVMGIIFRRDTEANGLSHGRLMNSMRSCKQQEVMDSLSWILESGFITAQLVERASNKIPTVFYKITQSGVAYLSSMGRA